ncbi:hypothetical protein B0H13DRAFT_2041665 [Mycena leptocephala]|nr:hypothetical protein B0H13DRAFT_2041665 [Mycena leptocephala]
MPSSRHTGVDGLAPEPLRVPRWIVFCLHPRVRGPALQEHERVGVVALGPSPPCCTAMHPSHRAAPLRALCLHATSRAPPPLTSPPASTVFTSPLSQPTQFTMRAPAIVLCPPRVSLTGLTAPARRTLGRIARRLLRPLSLATHPPLTPTYHSPRTSTRSIPAMCSAAGTPFSSPRPATVSRNRSSATFTQCRWQENLVCFFSQRARHAAVARAVPALMDCCALIISAFEYAYMY